MKGVQIFSHSLRQVMDNLGPALKVSGVLYLVQVGISLLLGYAMAAAGMGMMGDSFPRSTGRSYCGVLAT